MSAIDASQISRQDQEAPYPGLSFITVLNPGESKLPSQRKAVRSHAALYSAARSGSGSKPLAQKKHPRKCKREALWRGETITFDIDPSPKSKHEYQELILPPKLRDQLARRLSYPSTGLLGAGRVDPFRTYPVPWEPFIPELVDHCSYFFPSLSKKSQTYQLTLHYLDIINMAIDMPELDEPERPGLLRTRWFPMVMTEAATFQVIILLAASHFALLQPSSNYGPNLLQLKSKAISSVRSALTSDGPSDQLIGAVAKMASYEAMFGDQESLEKHMVGLLKMIEMRGGLSSLGLNGMLARICVWIDRNSAMLHNTPIHFTSVPEELSVEVNPSGFLAIR